MNILVCGSRGWTDFDAVKARIELTSPTLDAIVCGYDPVKQYPPGADQHAYRACYAIGRQVVCVPAMWQWWKDAGTKRNRTMADLNIGLVIAFRALGKSNGTDDMVRHAQSLGIDVEVLR